MSAKIHGFIRHNILGLVAIFIALSGTAYAVDGPLPGQNQVGSEDIIEAEVQNADLGPSAVTGAKVFPSTLTGSDVAPSGLTGSDIAADSLTSSDIGAGAVASSEVADGSLGTAEFAASIPAARVARTSAQGITSGIPSKRLNFTSERYDTAGLHSNSSNLSRLTAPVTGIYEVTAHVSWDFNSSGSRHVGLANGGTTLAEEHLNANATPDGQVDQNISTVARFTAGQFAEVFCYPRQRRDPERHRRGHDDLAGAGMSEFAVAQLEEIGEISDGREPWRPVRHHFGITSFGINAWTGREAGDRIINEHDEEGENEELYFVQSGRARFELEGERVDAPAGTFVFVASEREADGVRGGARDDDPRGGGDARAGVRTGGLGALGPIWPPLPGRTVCRSGRPGSGRGRGAP